MSLEFYTEQIETITVELGDTEIESILLDYFTREAGLDPKEAEAYTKVKADAPWPFVTIIYKRITSATPRSGVIVMREEESRGIQL